MEANPFAVSEFEMNYGTYRKFYKFHLTKTRLTRISYNLFYYVILIGLAAGVFYGIITSFDFIAIGIIIVLIILFLLKIYIDFILPKIFYDRSRKIYDSNYSIKLFDDYFQTETKGKMSSGASNVNYSALYRAYETDDMFYFYITPGQAYFMRKDSLSGDAVLRLRGILMGVMDKNFRKKF